MTWVASSANSRDAASTISNHRLVAAGAFLVAGSFVYATSDLAGQRPPQWNISPDSELQIGKASGDTGYLFDAIQSGRFLPDGRIIVADAGYLEMRVYGSDGALELRMGGEGQGPGEFSSIRGMWLTTEGKIGVWDPGNRRITLFRADGVLESTHRVSGDHAGGNLEVFFGSFSNDDIILGSLYSGGGGRQVTADPWVLGRVTLDGQFREGLGHVRGMWRFDGNPIPFSPMPYLAVHRDSLLVSDNYDMEITVRDESGLEARTIQLPRESQASSHDIWTSLEAELRRRQNRQLYLELLERERVPRDDEFPQIAAVFVDDRGRVWIKTYDPYVDTIWLRKHPLWAAPGGEWRVIHPGGEILSLVRLPEDLRLLDVEGDRLLGVVSDALGVERIVVKRIVH